MASHEVRVVLLQVDSEADSELGGVVEIDDVGRVDLALVVGVGQECAAMSVLLLVEVGRSTDGSEAVVEVLAVVMVEALGLALVGRVAVLVVGRPDLDSALDALVHGVGTRGDSWSVGDVKRGDSWSVVTLVNRKAWDFQVLPLWLDVSGACPFEGLEIRRRLEAPSGQGFVDVVIMSGSFAEFHENAAVFDAVGVVEENETALCVRDQPLLDAVKRFDVDERRAQQRVDGLAAEVADSPVVEVWRALARVVEPESDRIVPSALSKSSSGSSRDADDGGELHLERVNELIEVLM